MTKIPMKKNILVVDADFVFKVFCCSFSKIYHKGKKRLHGDVEQMLSIFLDVGGEVFFM